MWLAQVPQPRRQNLASDDIYTLHPGGLRPGTMRSIPSSWACTTWRRDQVEECWQLLQQSMRSVSFETLGYVPGYSAWLSEQDWTGAYRRHRRNLQMIGLHDAGKRWVLKNPSHLFALDALLTVYPDALVIQTHRTPRTAIASACSLAAHASAGSSPAFTRDHDGSKELDLWARGLSLFTAERARHDPARFCDVRYDGPGGEQDEHGGGGLRLLRAAADRRGGRRHPPPGRVVGDGGPRRTGPRTATRWMSAPGRLGEDVERAVRCLRGTPLAADGLPASVRDDRFVADITSSSRSARRSSSRGRSCCRR